VGGAWGGGEKGGGRVGGAEYQGGGVGAEGWTWDIVRGGGGGDRGDEGVRLVAKEMGGARISVTMRRYTGGRGGGVYRGRAVGQCGGGRGRGQTVMDGEKRWGRTVRLTTVEDRQLTRYNTCKNRS